MTNTPAALLDTDILSEVMRARDPRVLKCAEDYLAEHARFTHLISPVAFAPITACDRLVRNTS